MKQILGFLLAVSGITVATWAGATQWFSGNGVSGGNEISVKDGTTGTGTQTIQVRAYSTTTIGNPPSQSGTFSASASVQQFSGTEGFGINNGLDSGESSFPEWGVDNNELYDVLVFEMPSSGWTLDSLGLGWVANAGTDISVFWGGNNLGAGYGFSNACFTGCTNSLTSANMGFQQVNLDNVSVGSIDPNLNNAGRYLVVSGSLVTSVGDDKFKVNMVGATKTPAPGTLALLGLGLAGLIGYRRRAAQQA